MEMFCVLKKEGKEKEKDYPEKGHMAPEGIFWLGL
jgi:hypothetical protein